MQCYHVKVNEFLRRNLPSIEKIYKGKGSKIVTHAKKKFITVAECKLYMIDMGIQDKISLAMTGSCYYESILFIPDTIRQPRYEEMLPNEFLVFICRITY